jgi:hypothetical protein
MAQNRDAPAFQEYAASMLARSDFRALDLVARGLLYTLRLECWVNGSVPADPMRLAKVLGLQAEGVRTALPELAPFFKVKGSDLTCPELDDYRAHLEDRRRRQSAGGKAGAAKTNQGRALPTSAGEAAATPQVGRGSLVKQSPEKARQAKSLEGGEIDREWINEYEQESRGH